MFAYYAQWTTNYWDKIKPHSKYKVFSNKRASIAILQCIKKCLFNDTLDIIDDKKQFITENDALEVAILASLNQQNKPVPGTEQAILFQIPYREHIALAYLYLLCM